MDRRGHRCVHSTRSASITEAVFESNPLFVLRFFCSEQGLGRARPRPFTAERHKMNSDRRERLSSLLLGDVHDAGELPVVEQRVDRVEELLEALRTRKHVRQRFMSHADSDTKTHRSRIDSSEEERARDRREQKHEKRECEGG
eukprot:2818896-Rhodomonas_salina.1